MSENIGMRLRDLRLSQMMTLEDVSQKLGIARQTLFKYETGIITNIPLDKIEFLAKIYGVKSEEITGWVTPAEPTQSFASKKHKVLYDRLQNATEADLEKMERILDLIQEEIDRES